MVLASIRLGFLLTTLLASLHLAAEPRFWTLTGVRFNDGTVATGYFSYDDATQTIANWNIHVDQHLFPSSPPFTYIPGNSQPYTFQASFAVPRTLGLSAPLGTLPGGDFVGRGLQITPLTPLDGSNTTVPIITWALDSRDFFVSREDFGETWGFWIVAGALELTPLLPPAIDARFTGVWYDPAQNGHGLFIEVLPGNRMLAAWLTFSPASTQQAWFIGVGTYSGNTATVTKVEQPTGGRWIPNFDANQIVHNNWGTLTFTFTDCNHGKVDFNSTLGYGVGSMNLTRLTQPAGLSCP